MSQNLIHEILLRAVTEVRDVLIETQDNLELAKLLNITITIPEPQPHDELENHFIDSSMLACS